MKPTCTKRSGFTLIELLIVIAIIAILASILLVAVMKSFALVPQNEAASDIHGLHQSVAAFKNHFRVDYLPSRITLAKMAADTDPDSRTFITRMYPNCIDKWAATGLIWNADAPNDTVTLQGHECLVFFLGGPVINATPGPDAALTPPKWTQPKGWALNARDPIDATNTERKSFYDFQQARLIKYGAGRKYLSYVDPWRSMPYAYFTSGRKQNSYNIAGGFGDCELLVDSAGGHIRPYGEVATLTFQHPTSYQIITSGADMKWGQKFGTWSQVTAPTDYQRGDPGADDMCNFYKGKLGNKQ